MGNSSISFHNMYREMVIKSQMSNIMPTPLEVKGRNHLSKRQKPEVVSSKLDKCTSKEQPRRFIKGKC
uniref:Uncharacterized protein n=1 Tax=Gossypium raimondii TaxID=29730 RepID=A0A0D2U0Q3_GOSRA|nr:hypothetical protein B456_008G102100 [Gossypium raimondii]